MSKKIIITIKDIEYKLKMADEDSVGLCNLCHLNDLCEKETFEPTGISEELYTCCNQGNGYWVKK